MVVDQAGCVLAFDSSIVVDEKSNSSYSSLMMSRDQRDGVSWCSEKVRDGFEKLVK